LMWTWISILKFTNAFKAFLSVNMLRNLRSQPTTSFGIQQYLDFYVACSTNAKIRNIQTCTDSFQPPAMIPRLEEEWVGSLTNFGCCTGGGNVSIIHA
jgi:hypothetical protein